MAPPVQARPRLREAILEHLRKGSDSISGITRALAPLPGAPVHRLTVAGYLAALSDQGVLHELERPPSKHYQLADPDQALTLHQRIGAIVSDLDLPAPERATLVVATLQHLLGRPVFLAELHHAGFPRMGPGIEAVEAGEDERREYRALFRRRHAFDLDIPRADPLLTARSGAISAALVSETVRRIVLGGLPGAKDLVAEGPHTARRATQSRLDLEGRP